MAIEHIKRHRVWTVTEAKARLSEIMRIAEEEGPQHIGTRRPFVIVPADTWYAKISPRKPLGQWLVDNIPSGIDLEIPDRRETVRDLPFITQEGE